MKEYKTANYKQSKYNPKDPDFEMDSMREEALVQETEGLKDFNPTKVWEFIKSRPFYNPEFQPQMSDAREIYEQFIINDPATLEKYMHFKGSGSNTEDSLETRNRGRRDNYGELDGFQSKTEYHNDDFTFNGEN